MSATPRAINTPRTIRPVTLPAASARMRRLTGLQARPFGTISLFLAATAILGLTSLCYLWQTAQTTMYAEDIPALKTELSNAQNTTLLLQSQINRLQEPGVVMNTATGLYGMQMATDPGSERVVTVQPPDQTRVVVIPAAPRQTTTRVRLATTNTAVSSWWQTLWSILYSVMH